MALLAAWGRTEFGRYAAAVGAAVWLTPLVQAGPEKAILKLFPRARRTRSDLIRPLRAAVAFLPLPFGAVAVAVTVVQPSGTAALYCTAAAYHVSLGCTLLGTALYRALGRPGYDLAGYAVLSAGLAVLLGSTLLVGLPPIVFLWGLLTLTTALNVAFVRGLPAGGPRTGRTGRLLAATVLLMGAPEVMTNAATSALYVELAFTGHADQSGELYLVLMGWSLLIAAGYFAQRMFQPAASVRLTGHGAALGRARARRLAQAVLWAGPLWFAAAALAVAVVDARIVLLVALTASRVPLYLAMAYATYLLENTGSRNLRSTAAGGVAGLVAVVLTGAVTVPLFGAVGAVFALAVKEVVLAPVVIRAAGRT
ncbi:hypothetical protein ACGFNU_39170 [Spirillospora sp. NPDC048911]|uniref:hypothetical protein n=1 Tax=Spirillospora sp. NPDC048911 TaxID=3364527 RepID=UPI00371AF43F